MGHSPRLAVVGSANIDISATVPRLPALGETISCLRSSISPGGKGANQAVAAARMGADVSMIAKLGQDIFGDMLLSSLGDSGVRTEHIIRTGDASTGKAFIIICDGNNEIIIEGGSNQKLTRKEIEEKSELLLTADGVLLQLEIPLETVERTIQICKGRVPVHLNPSPYAVLPEGLLEGLDFFTPNEFECAFYTGIQPQDEASIHKALDRLVEMGIRYPIVTLGSKGAAYFNGKKNVIARPFEIDAVDSTAAGDTFSGAFAATISKGVSIEEAVEIAQAAAAITCTRYGAQSAIPVKKEVDEFIKCNSTYTEH